VTSLPRLVAAVPLLALAVSCRRCGRVPGEAGKPAVDAGRPGVVVQPVTPPVWERHVVKQTPRGRQVSAAQIVLCWKGTPATWVPQRARQRTLEEARALAEEVVAKARAGADFAELAVKYSDWPLADRKIASGYGGRLGLLTEGTSGYPEAYKRIFDLKVGEVSDPVPSNFGLHVFKRLPAVRLGEILVTHEGAGKVHAPRTEAEARQLAQKIEDELASGKSFADEAFAYSDDVGSAGRGGDIGSFERENLIPADLREAAKRLRVGQTSAPFETPIGLVILQRTE
jgi:peptidyl-prolyl cis-trans isomerase SurA